MKSAGEGRRARRLNMEIELLWVGWGLPSAPFDASVRGEVRPEAERKTVVIDGRAAGRRRARQIEGSDRDLIEGDRRPHAPHSIRSAACSARWERPNWRASTTTR